jgi:hypothetical protein
MLLLIGSGLALTPTTTHAEQEWSAIPISGQSDWLIVPPVIPSEYVTFHPDGGFTIKGMPLKGNIHLSAAGFDVEGFAYGILDAEIDANLNGPIVGPMSITEVINGKEKVVFDGAFFGSVAQLRASGQIVFEGRGHYAGMTISVSLLETDNNSEIFTLTGALLDRKK